MRPEQAEAVRLTAAYFRRKAKEEPGTRPRFLWNAKMRFGKTFAAYELAKAMGFRRILILTFKPAVVSAWEEDCLTHVDFEGWQFIRRRDQVGTRGAVGPRHLRRVPLRRVARAGEGPLREGR